MKKRLLAVFVSMVLCLQSQFTLVAYATETVEAEPDPVVVDDEEKVECICETPCTEEVVNQDCPVCKTESADLTKCLGTREETTTTMDEGENRVDNSTLPESEELVEDAAEYGTVGDSWNEEVSANGNKITTYINEDEGNVKRTIHWTLGVDPPKMGGTNPEFKKLITNQGGTHIEYIAPYVSGRGWYDANKAMNGDQNLCFVAATANSLQWWVDRNEENIRQYLDRNQNYSPERRKAVEEILNTKDIDQHNSPIYKKYFNIFKDRQKGYWPDLLIAHFINGYPIDHDDEGTIDPDFTDGDNLLLKGPDRNGGYFFDIFKKNTLSYRYQTISNYGELKNLLKKIDNGELLMLTFAMSHANSHVVTLWGVEYNEAGNPVAVYYTDSDDIDSVENGMRRYKLYEKGGVPYITTNTTNQSGSLVQSINTLVMGDSKTWNDGINELAKGNQQPPTGLTLDSATEDSITLQEVAVSDKGTKAEYSSDNGLNWRDTPKFDGLKPGTKYTFYARYKGNENYKPSDKSPSLIAYTLPSITTDRLPNGKVGVRYEQTLVANVEAGTTVTWSAQSKLPDGLTLDGNGTISGIPTTPSDAAVSFKVKATANGVSQMKEVHIMIEKGASSLGNLTVENGTTETSQFVYGDTIIIEGKISVSKRRGLTKVVTSLKKNQIALFMGDTQLTQPVDVGQDGTFRIAYNTTDDRITASSSEQTLTLKYGGSDTLDAGIAHVHIRLSPKSIRSADVTLTGIDDLVYDGNEKVPVIEVKLENKVLNASTDYVVNYFNSYGGEGNHTNAGEVTVTIVGKGNYGDSVIGNFTINKASAPDIQWPTASAIEYGQSLADSKLTGGSTEFGSFVWADTSIMPQSGTGYYMVSFIPSEDTQNNYDEISVKEQNVEINVERANPVLALKPSVEKIYGGGEVTLTLTGLPEGARAEITCSDTAIALSSSGENTWKVILPDSIKTYTFRAIYHGDANYNGTKTECKIEVAPKSNDDGSSSGGSSSSGGDSSSGGGSSSGSGLSSNGDSLNGGGLSSAKHDKNEYTSKIKKPGTKVQTPATVAQKGKNSAIAVDKPKDSVEKAKSDTRQQSGVKNSDETMENAVSKEQEKKNNLGLLVFPILFMLAAVGGGIWFMIRRIKR